jgi:DNA (cytosine-5)-methyltransferase 1
VRGASLFSGVGGLDLGLGRAGVEIVFQCEQDPYRRRVLERHWPGVPCFEDVREVARPERDGGRGPLAGGLDGADAGEGAVERHTGPHALDLLCGGFPCQDLSVAGRRARTRGERSGLFFEFARIADALLGTGGWVLIENVPGLLSSNGGRDFAVLLATLAELGFHDLAWRVLDSRYFGVPQRRRRVFILARRARGRRAAEVLLEPESGGGDFEAGREAGPRVAASLSGFHLRPRPSPRRTPLRSLRRCRDRERGRVDRETPDLPPRGVSSR